MDFDESSSSSLTREFIAVVLAGFGHELSPLTSDQGEEPSPKALLPIANKPMLEYPLSWLEKSGVSDVLLICPTSHRSAMSNYIQSDVSSVFPTLRIDLQPYEESRDMADGTCTLLRHFSSRIQSDFILLPCDFVPPPSLSLAHLLNKFRTETTHDGSIATACFYEAHKPDKGVTMEEWGIQPTNPPIVFEEKKGTLLYVDTVDDADKNGEDFELRMSLLTQHPRTRLSSNFRDSHVYVCKRTVLDALSQKEHLDSFREEFIPWLCKPQYQRTRREKYSSVLSPVTNNISLGQALKHSTLHAPSHTDRLRHFTEGTETDDEHLRSVVPSPVEQDDEDAVPPSLRVGLVAHRASAGFASRANNLHAYLELNRFFLGQTPYSLPSDPENRSLIDQKAQISADSVIGRSTRVEERASIKRSVIGKHCVIGKMTKIVGCVLLDHCVIADGAKLDGCILGAGTKVGTKADLSRCVTQPGYDVPAGESLKHEKLEVSDWTAHETSASEDQDSDDDEDDESTEEESD
ncbi:UDP-3-O-glucosamine N-acyltransferase [Epithele typhae]|uniref:UDP-3-O-glucosamine N-acyltransferase n=1 Tax=Epithele typhae TaxID=378194 RepID=UPI0020088D0E|nr:UDP-3-O-glucosamine N-acyltransferase [Epithele typhae]KAH9929545.1 UDP-3-O-glucosamine N-acyltransferase [Epithele typhae]